MDNTVADSFDLFYAIYKYNPSSAKQLAKFEEAFSNLKKELERFGTCFCSSAVGLPLFLFTYLFIFGVEGPREGCVRTLFLLCVNLLNREGLGFYFRYV